jgi:hypothetical protein
LTIEYGSRDDGINLKERLRLRNVILNEVKNL